MLRQPIVCVLGHVDHGKTTLLDRIRSSAVAAKEAGGITQAIGATEIPSDSIRKISGELLDKLKISLEIPGLLFIDTPGHEAFTTLRKRGGSCSDLAILVVDVTKGFEPQTDESLNFLKQFKTPFIVAATKIDRVEGWHANEGESFLKSLDKQPEHVKEKADEAIYKILGQLSQRGFESERFDRVSDFKKTVAIVPVSGITGEGIPELIMMLSGLAQAFLKKELELSGESGKGIILEVKDFKGLGTTIDVILFDGKISRGDFLVVGGREPAVGKVKALLKPKPMSELRVEKDFENVDSVSAAAGIKVSATGIENAVAGSPVRAVKTEKEVDAAKAELKAEVEEVEFESEIEGAIVRADTLGSLEALIHILKQKEIPIRKAEVGPASRRDIQDQKLLKDNFKKLIFVFNVPVGDEILSEVKNSGVKILASNIIYRLFEEYDSWLKSEKEKLKQEKLASITMPCRMRILPGFVFRQSEPAVVGVEILSGELKSGCRLQKNKNEIGTLRQIQQESQTIEKAKAGERVAISIEGAVVGRGISEGDVLETIISENDLKVLEEFGAPEAGLAREILGKMKN